jgi:hypothetical protein
MFELAGLGIGLASIVYALITRQQSKREGQEMMEKLERIDQQLKDIGLKLERDADGRPTGNVVTITPAPAVAVTSTGNPSVVIGPTSPTKEPDEQ